MWQCHHQLFPLPPQLTQDYHCLLPGIIAHPWLPVLCSLIRYTQGLLCAFPNHFPVPCPFPRAASFHRAPRAPSMLTPPCHRHCCFPPPGIPTGSCGLHWILPPPLWPTLNLFLHSLLPTLPLSPRQSRQEISPYSCIVRQVMQRRIWRLQTRKLFSVLVPKLKHQKQRDLIGPVWESILTGLHWKSVRKSLLREIPASQMGLL